METVIEKAMAEAVQDAGQNKKARRLESLGFNYLGDELRRIKDAKRKMAVAYEHFRFVRQEKVDAFNTALRKQTLKYGNWQWKELSFTAIQNYDKCPPDDVLEQLESAQKMGCFDSYEVAHIVDVKDPIIFGRIENCTDRFFIGQWDKDITIDDLIGKNEG